MSKVTALPTVAQQANQSTITILEEILAEARTGNIQDVVVVYIERNGEYGIECSPTIDILTRAGALAHAQFVVLQSKVWEP